MNENLISSWKWGVITAVAMTFLTLVPQINLWLMPEREWQGSYFLLHADEIAYSAYINALIDGRTRLNDPYTGRDVQLDGQKSESLFSIQFVPAYLVATSARLLGVSASTAFIWLLAISTFLSTLAIFWLIRAMTGDDRLAAGAAVFVLCFGALIAGYGEIRTLLGSQGAGQIIMPFTRRYQPSATFPLFFVFCGLVWYSLSSEKKQNLILAATGAGLCLAALVFSYFFLWTAALGWLAGLVLLHFVFQREEWKRSLTVLAIVGVIAGAAFVPYLMLIARRSASLDATQALIATRLPDLFRPCEIVGILLLAVIIYTAQRGKLSIKEKLPLFAASFASLPLIVFNQQIITGYSLQPVHYELYIVNYVVLIAVVLTAVLMLQAWKQIKAPSKAFFWIAVLAFGWGFMEMLSVVKKDAQYSKIHDNSIPVLRRLAEIGKANGLTNAINEAVLVADIDVSDIAPTVAPQPVLWATHTPVFSGLQAGEGKERFFKYLYYTGVAPKDLAEALGKKDFTVTSAIFGFERALPALSSHTAPITADEIQSEVRSFVQYAQSFSKEQAARHPLSYIIAPAQAEPNYINIDRWYERNAGETVGEWRLYRVKLRP